MENNNITLPILYKKDEDSLSQEKNEGYAHVVIASMTTDAVLEGLMCI